MPLPVRVSDFVPQCCWLRNYTADIHSHGKYLLSLLDCQHQEKVGTLFFHLRRAYLVSAQPSVQKLVGSVAQDALVYLNEESCHTDGFTEDVPGVLAALEDLTGEFSRPIVDQAILRAAEGKSTARITLKNRRYAETVSTYKHRNSLSLWITEQHLGERNPRHSRASRDPCKFPPPERK